MEDVFHGMTWTIWYKENFLEFFIVKVGGNFERGTGPLRPDK